MENYFYVLRRCPLFDGIEEADLPAMLRCLNARVAHFDRGENILTAGEAGGRIGIVLSGMVHIIRDDYWGNRSIVEGVTSEILGESFACAGVSAIPVNAVAAESVRVMLIDCLKITRSCSNACEFHQSALLCRCRVPKNL